MTDVHEHIVPFRFSVSVPVAPVPEKVSVVVDVTVKPCTDSLHVTVSVGGAQLTVHMMPLSGEATPASFGKVSMVVPFVPHIAPFPAAGV